MLSSMKISTSMLVTESSVEARLPHGRGRGSVNGANGGSGSHYGRAGAAAESRDGRVIVLAGSRADVL